MKNLQISVITPEGVVFEGEADSIQLPGSEGSFQVLLNHAPIISNLTAGKVILANGNKLTNFTITEGVVEVLNNSVAVMAEKVIAE